MSDAGPCVRLSRLAQQRGGGKVCCAQLPPQPFPASTPVPVSRSKPWASFSLSLSVPPPRCFLGNEKALSALCGAGLPLDKPHIRGVLILAVAGVVHAVTSVLSAKKMLEQELPPLGFVLLK